MSSQSTGNEPAPTDPPPVPQDLSQSTQTLVSGQVESVKALIVAILKETTWPLRSNDAAQNLAQIIEDDARLNNIPQDENDISAEHRTSLERLLQVIEGVRTNLQAAAKKYGARERKLGSKVKYLFSSLDRSQCTEILETCQHDVNDALASLPDHWTSQAMRLDDEDGVPATHSGPPIATLQTTSGTVPTRKHQTLAPESTSKGPSMRGKTLSAIKTTLDTVEATSGFIPIVGSYVEAAAKVGKPVVQMLRVKVVIPATFGSGSLSIAGFRHIPAIPATFGTDSAAELG